MTVLAPTRVRFDTRLRSALVTSISDDPTEAAVVEASQQSAPAATARHLEDETPPDTNELLIIAESGDLERTWGTLILATTAAASGMQVSVFLTFWGFYPLVRPGIRITGQNWMQKMLSVLNRPGIDHLKMSRLDFLGMGPWMAKRLAKRNGVAEPRELLEMAQALGVKLIPCQMTMDMFGLTRDDLIEGLEEPAGAATVLGAMARGVPALFI